jgi:hypothetical protein
MLHEISSDYPIWEGGHAPTKQMRNLLVWYMVEHKYRTASLNVIRPLNGLWLYAVAPQERNLDGAEVHLYSFDVMTSRPNAPISRYCSKRKHWSLDLPMIESHNSTVQFKDYNRQPVHLPLPNKFTLERWMHEQIPRQNDKIFSDIQNMLLIGFVSLYSDSTLVCVVFVGFHLWSSGLH